MDKRIIPRPYLTKGRAAEQRRRFAQHAAIVLIVADASNRQNFPQAEPLCVAEDRLPLGFATGRDADLIAMIPAGQKGEPEAASFEAIPDKRMRPA